MVDIYKELKLLCKEILQRDSFCYRGLIICNDREIDEDFEYRVKVRWLKWRLDSGVLCDQLMPARLKEKFYRTMIGLAMTYGAK